MIRLRQRPISLKTLWLPGIALCAGLLRTLSAAAQTDTLDPDGIRMLLPSAPGGSQLRLGTQDPNTHARFAFDYHASASAAQADGVHYWNLAATPLTYASGRTGTTARLHLYASGGRQQFNWKTQPGYLGNPADISNQEFTVYLRMHGLLTPRTAQATLKIRGGGHHATDPDAASSTMLTFAPASSPARSRFGKELSHPLYDYVALSPLFDAALPDGSWVGLKLLSWADPHHPAQVVYQLHIDTTPFDSSGRPANHWRLFSTYTDAAGKSTGHYDTLVHWGGWQTTVRMDGYRSMDFAYPSIREVTPPP
jgi:hypothetical protein